MVSVSARNEIGFAETEQTVYRHWSVAGAGIAAILLGLSVVAPLFSQEPGPRRPIEFIEVKSKASLAHLGSLDSFDRTDKGTEAARAVLDALDSKKPEAARKLAAKQASDIYERIIPGENFGGEYTALQWLCDYILASPDDKKKILADPYVNAFYQYWAKDDFAALNDYVRFKYRLDTGGTKPKQSFESERRHRFQEDFILFNNPRRERWEKSSKIIEKLALKQGDTVADIGSGPGYFSFKFANLVGPKGAVYALDNNLDHIDYLKSLIKDLKVANVHPALSTPEEFGIPEGVKVDCAFMCSLYHVIYTSFSQEEREGFIEQIKAWLKPDGRLVIVDNALVEEKNLPYHGPYIAKELIIAQFEHSGFTLVEESQVITQRYMLVFKPTTEKSAPKSPRKPTPPGSIAIDSSASLLEHLNPGNNPFKFSLDGRMAAKDFFKALDKNDKEAAAKARTQYVKLSQEEKIGNEYTAFIWFCDYILADEAQRKKILEDKHNKDYFDHLGGEAFTVLKKYLRTWYQLDVSDDDLPDPTKIKLPDEPIEQVFEWQEMITFNNPRRETWEKTSEVMKFLKLKSGQTVADVGCGHGYFTFKFSDAVGPTGRVYALETNDDTLKIFKERQQKYPELKNVLPRKSTYDNCGLPPNSVDVMYLCSVYDAIYVSTIDFVRERFIASMKVALRKDGRLVIVDNEINVGKSPPYYGPRIDRRLIIEQLKHFGFKLVDSGQFIPQRYVLVFQLEDKP